MGVRSCFLLCHLLALITSKSSSSTKPSRPLGLQRTRHQCSTAPLRSVSAYLSVPTMTPSTRVTPGKRLKLFRLTKSPTCIDHPQINRASPNLAASVIRLNNTDAVTIVASDFNNQAVLRLPMCHTHPYQITDFHDVTTTAMIPAQPTLIQIARIITISMCEPLSLLLMY